MISITVKFCKWDSVPLSIIIFPLSALGISLFIMITFLVGAVMSVLTFHPM